MKLIWLRRRDWITDAWIAVIPLLLVWITVVAVVATLNDYLNPPPIRRWFAARLTTPYVTLHLGFIPWYRPLEKWDASTT